MTDGATTLVRMAQTGRRSTLGERPDDVLERMPADTLGPDRGSAR